jgi:hypothetical protein
MTKKQSETETAKPRFSEAEKAELRRQSEILNAAVPGILAKTQPAEPTEHILREVQEGTINPRIRCSCGWVVTSYSAYERAESHRANSR